MAKVKFIPEEVLTDEVVIKEEGEISPPSKKTIYDRKILLQNKTEDGYIHVVDELGSTFKLTQSDYDLLKS